MGGFGRVEQHKTLDFFWLGVEDGGFIPQPPKVYAPNMMAPCAWAEGPHAHGVSRAENPRSRVHGEENMP